MHRSVPLYRFRTVLERPSRDSRAGNPGVPLYSCGHTPRFRCIATSSHRVTRRETPECRCMPVGHTRLVAPVRPERRRGHTAVIGRVGNGPTNGADTVVPLYRIKRVSIGTAPVGSHTAVPLYAETHTPRCRCNGVAVGIDSKRRSGGDTHGPTAVWNSY